MVFSVKYRDSSGAVCEKAVEAASRADCFAKCKAQGILPVGVELDTGKKKRGKSANPKRRNPKAILTVAALVAAGMAVSNASRYIWS